MIRNNFSTFIPLFFILACILGSCQKPHPAYDVFGPEEFVYDSKFIYEQKKNGIDEMRGQADAELSDNALCPQQNVIGEDDILQITFYHPSRRDLMDSIQLINERRGGIRVTDGKISLPYIKEVSVVGLTLSEAREKIKLQLQNEIADADIFIKFISSKSNVVEFTGVVAHTFIPVDGRKRLYEVLAEARIPPFANLYGSYIIRNDVKLNVDLSQLIKEGDMSQNIVMKGGDKIFIAGPTEQFAMIMGEVPMQTPIPLPRGFIPLKEALGLVRGIPFTGDRKCIQVIRGGIVNPKIYVLSLEFILNEPNNNLLLIPGDMVYVSQAPITKWYLFFNKTNQTLIQLPPTIGIIKHGLSR
jgi:polysaccharide biosynthesis/export protein